MNYILTVAVPIYNTEQYLLKCLKSILIADDVEVIAVIDGSPDNSESLALSVQASHPNNLKIISKANGGHGSAINTALKSANGKYFRIIDSDDWFDTISFSKFLQKLRSIDVDIVMTGLIEERVHENKSKQHSVSEFKFNSVIDIDDVKLQTLPIGFFGMARCTYKTDQLRSNNLKLLENCFFEDSYLHAFAVSYAETLISFDLDVYHYLIGREGQTVTSTITVNHIGYWNKVIIQINELLSSLDSLSKNRKNFIHKILYEYISHQHNLILKLPRKHARLEIMRFREDIVPIYNQLRMFELKTYISYKFPFFTYWIILKINYALYKMR